MNFIWTDLPDTVRQRLLWSGVGKLHLYDTAHTVFQSMNIHRNAAMSAADMFALGADLLLAAWEAAPFDTTLASTLFSLHTKQPFLPPLVAGIVRVLAKRPGVDEETLKSLDLVHLGNVQLWHSSLLRAQRKGALPLPYLEQAVDVSFKNHDIGWLRRLVDNAANVPKPLHQGLKADITFAEGDYRSAALAYGAAYSQLPLLTWKIRQAESVFRNGDRDAALVLWNEAYQARPWNINTLLRLHDVQEGRDLPSPLPAGRTVVLLYTWNKIDEINATLKSLADSQLGAFAPDGDGVRVIVLDNGSTDATPTVLAQWEDRFAGRMGRVTLPVNVGAPAARNWLLALPEVRASDFTVFLDDDVLIPPDWLGHLMRGIHTYPASGVVSGHAVDMGRPLSQQWTDMHMIPKDLPDKDGHDTLRDSFTFTSMHTQVADFGEFHFMRPCVTAIGCCHLFTREAREQGGFFDIRFSPSQSDDVDHDLRRCLAGHLPVYNGHLTVHHKRATGYHKGGNTRTFASALCNWYKLQASYSSEEIARITALDQEQMFVDAVRAAAVIAQRAST